jgi:hypothetical protein
MGLSLFEGLIHARHEEMRSLHATSVPKVRARGGQLPTQSPESYWREDTKNHRGREDPDRLRKIGLRGH